MKKRMGYLAAAVLMCFLTGMLFRIGESLRRNFIEDQNTAGSLQESTLRRNEDLVVLDPGHGGIDGGKTGVNGAEEKEINLSVALKVKALLEEEKINVVMTRTDDQRLGGSQVEDLKERASLMDQQNAVLTVSIHQNSYHEESVSGAQVFYYTDSREGEIAAGTLQKALRRLDPDNTKEAKANNTYYILKKTEVPVVIVECGFLSNYAEAEKLVDDGYQQELAGAIAEGIMEYIESR